MDKYAVIGHPISHSLSPLIHSAFAKQTQQSIEYITIEAPLNAFAETVYRFRDNGGKGMNVTMPFKSEAFSLADDASEIATQAKAANLLVFDKANHIYADNVDGSGLIIDLTENYHHKINQKNILILGAGGAARGIIPAILTLNPKKLTLANRTVSRALEITQVYNLDNFTAVALTSLEPSAFDLIINTTSAGFNGPPLKLPSAIVSPNTICYDIMYGDQGTPFLNWAKQQKANHCYDGLGMLVEQAALSFERWRGIKPSTHEIIAMLRKRVG